MEKRLYSITVASCVFISIVLMVINHYFVFFGENSSSLAFYETGVFNPLGQLYYYLIFEIFFLGSILFFGLFIFSQYLHFRDRTYLYYLGYLIITFFYFLRNFGFDYQTELLYSDHSISYRAESFLSAGLIISYVLFVTHFLNVNITSSKKLARLYWLIIWICIISACADLILGITTDGKNLIDFECIFKITILSVIGYTLYETLKIAEKRLVLYVIIGSLLLFSGTLITGCIGIIDHFEQVLQRPLIHKLFYHKLGTFAEIICFTIGLGYKSKLQQDESLKRIKKQVEVQRDLVETRLEALKANLNRHFIFNSLTSAKFCIQNKEYEKAINYIEAFSFLLRETLKLSNHRVIPLSLELEYCRKYLNLERERLDSKFDYSIIESPAIDTSYFTIPPLALQPLLENAVNHGIIPLKRHGKIAIHMKVEGEQFFLFIEDNGIGIKAGWQASKKKEGSFGLLFAKNLLANQSIQMEIKNKKDLPDSNGQGTLITLIFKL